MKIAIVGSSHLSEAEMLDARKNSGLVLNQMIKEFGKDNIVFISGGAKGVDSEAEDVARQLGIKCETEKYKPKTQFWETGYKPRNMMIARDCDILYCFPTKLKAVACYHCKANDHEVTGGCWTMKQAKILKKKTFLIPLI